jgi:hypothetical protein
MKKLITLLALLLSFNVYAKDLCNFADDFRFVYKGKGGIVIIDQATADQDIMLKLTSINSFELTGNGKCYASGHAHVRVIKDSIHWCIFDIQDGNFDLPKIISTNCSGLQYAGMYGNNILWPNSFTLYIK